VGILASFGRRYAYIVAGQDFVLNGPGLAHLRAYLPGVGGPRNRRPYNIRTPSFVYNR